MVTNHICLQLTVYKITIYIFVPPFVPPSCIQSKQTCKADQRTVGAPVATPVCQFLLQRSCLQIDSGLFEEMAPHSELMASPLCLTAEEQTEKLMEGRLRDTEMAG